MSLSEGGVSADGNWRYKYKRGFIKLRDSGSFTASANGISISVSVILGANSDGAPTISATGCHCSIRDVNFRLHGGASWLYNIFLRLVTAIAAHIKSSILTLLALWTLARVSN